MSEYSQIYQAEPYTARSGATPRPFLVKPGAEPPKPATSPWCMSHGKRCFDLLLSLPLLLLLLPMLVLVACLIRITSPGPAFFLQERVGLHRRPFRILKFRTMTHCIGDDCGPRVTRSGDPRMTPLGATLRRWKIDELPQLVNVIRGEMSLVGPRPKLAEHEQMYLTCRPGVTGAATVAFAHEEAMLAAIPEQLIEEYAIAVLSPLKHRLDARYAAEASLGTDLHLLLRTAARLKIPGTGRWVDDDASGATMPPQHPEPALFLHTGLALPERLSN